MLGAIDGLWVISHAKCVGKGYLMEVSLKAGNLLGL